MENVVTSCNLKAEAFSNPALCDIEGKCRTPGCPYVWPGHHPVGVAIPLLPPPERVNEFPHADNLLEGAFAELRISNKGAASGFAASKCKVPENCGFSASFPVPFMRPKLVTYILESFVPSSEDIRISSTVVERALTVSILTSKIHETNDRDQYELCVESIAGNEIEKYLSFQTSVGIKYKRQMYLKELIGVRGIATDSSHSDGIVYSIVEKCNVGTGVVELKDTAFAPFEQLGQLFATASNLCLGQLKHGLPHDKCCVAIMATNGHLYQFGFVTLLYPSFPVLHLTSHVLDSLDAEGLRTIAQHLYRFRETCRLQDTLLRDSRIVNGEIFIALDSKQFYQKPISNVFERCDSRLQSILNMYKIYQRLHDYKYEEAVLPVAIKSGLLDEKHYLNNDYLLFPMLQDEFRMGVPLDDDDFGNYLHALTLAYKRMHSVGVVHLDGYPSNILWSKSLEGEIVIRFVDFDVASFIDRDFDVGISNKLGSMEISKSHYYWNESKVASEKHDAWFVYLYSKMTLDERRASSEAATKKDVDAVISNYWRLVQRMRSTCNIVAEFNTWLVASWQNSGVKVDKVPKDLITREKV